MRLETDRLMQAQLAMSRLTRQVELAEAGNEISSRVKLFEAVTWFPYLQQQVNASKCRGMRGKCRDVTVLTWCCAGRCLIQLEKGRDRLTLVTADDEKPWQRDMAHVAPFMGPMGWQGVDADHVEALKMIYTCTRYGDEIKLADDEKVSIG